MIKKYCEPAHDTMEYNPAMEMMQSVHVPEKWKVEIIKDVDGKIVTRTLSIKEEQYDQCVIGKWASFD